MLNIGSVKSITSFPPIPNQTGPYCYRMVSIQCKRNPTVADPPPPLPVQSKITAIMLRKITVTQAIDFPLNVGFVPHPLCPLTKKMLRHRSFTNTHWLLID